MVFYRSLIFPKSKNVKAIVLNNTYSECNKWCLSLNNQKNMYFWSEFSKKFRKKLRYNQQKWCYTLCERNFSVKNQLEQLKYINQSRFFDTSHVIESISDNLSYCKKK